MKSLFKKFKNPVRAILFSVFVILFLSAPLLAQPNQTQSKPIEVRIDFPPSDAPFGGFVGGFDKNGKPSVQKFTDPVAMASSLGVSVDDVLNKSKQLPAGGETSATVVSKKASQITALFNTPQARIDAYAIVTDSVFTLNQLNLSDTFNYNGTYVSAENASAVPWWKSETGWSLVYGPTISWGPNPLPATNDYVDSYAQFRNATIPGGPYNNSLTVSDYVYGNGSVYASYLFSFSEQKSWWQFWGSYSRTQTANSYYPPFYRLFNGRDHFYTESWAEAMASGYNYEGIAAYMGLSNEGGTAPFYRSHNPTSGDHFYTTSWAEAHTTGYNYEGVAGYIYATQISGTIPFYRSYNPSNGDHFYTESWAEAHTAGYNYERVAGYVR